MKQEIMKEVISEEEQQKMKKEQKKKDRSSRNLCPVEERKLSLLMQKIMKVIRTNMNVSKKGVLGRMRQ